MPTSRKGKAVPTEICTLKVIEFATCLTEGKWSIFFYFLGAGITFGIFWWDISNESGPVKKLVGFGGIESCQRKDFLIAVIAVPIDTTILKIEKLVGTECSTFDMETFFAQVPSNRSCSI